MLLTACAVGIVVANAVAAAAVAAADTATTVTTAAVMLKSLVSGQNHRQLFQLYY